MWDLYNNSFDSVSTEWLHGVVSALMAEGRVPVVSKDDLRVFALWLRGFHAHYINADSVALGWLTSQSESMGYPVRLFLQHYLTVQWERILLEIPTLPSFPDLLTAADWSRYGDPKPPSCNTGVNYQDPPLQLRLLPYNDEEVT